MGWDRNGQETTHYRISLAIGPVRPYLTVRSILTDA